MARGFHSVTGPGKLALRWQERAARQQLRERRRQQQKASARARAAALEAQRQHDH